MLRVHLELVLLSRLTFAPDCAIVFCVALVPLPYYWDPSERPRGDILVCLAQSSGPARLGRLSFGVGVFLHPPKTVGDLLFVCGSFAPLVEVCLSLLEGKKRKGPGWGPSFGLAAGLLGLGGLGGVVAGLDALDVGGAAGTLGTLAELLTHGGVLSGVQGLWLRPCRAGSARSASR